MSLFLWSLSKKILYLIADEAETNNSKVRLCYLHSVLDSWDDKDDIIDEHPGEEEEPNQVTPYVHCLVVQDEQALQATQEPDPLSIALDKNTIMLWDSGSDSPTNMTPTRLVGKISAPCANSLRATQSQKSKNDIPQ